MAKYSDIKGFTVQTVSTDPANSLIDTGSWASGGSMNTARYDGAAGGTLILGGSAAHTSKLVIASNDGSSNGNLLVEGGDGTDFLQIGSNGELSIY